ncbi:helix-turn-helix domain-containing protein [Chryseobacterium sp. FDAARGOS 1104]|uniref:Helix-turn-helix domain n=2 Tax=Chryseobacterium taihuense TaxID=1141221 RepID=A0A4U8W8I2_9FLAO|nr:MULTISPECIES: helix-turn-helix transcriptional regulator [Chryseobacterium]QQV04080.1 helix-turn-helix domain-containing protein [Chryseobacterium sp. FDAARGOS 1104]VFB02557.1 Helix-turn-helix domain [Chryseobacterium taihuense]
MAEELHISQAAYSKIEKNETKLTVDRLYQIAEILEAPVYELLDVNPNNIYNQQNFYDASVGYQDIQNLYQENKDKTDKIESLYEERLKDKDKMIEQLQDIISALKK